MKVELAYNEAKHKVKMRLSTIGARVDAGTLLAIKSGGVTWPHVGDLNYVATELDKLVKFLDSQDGLED